jgi:hypothetical protein
VRVIADTRYFRLSLDPQRMLVRWARTNIVLESVDEYEQMTHATVLALLPIDRPKHAMLIDLRDAPLRNDPGFEEINRRFRRDLHHGFARSAVLVRTRAGMLQINRHTSEFPGEVRGHRAFMVEEDAVAFLTAV